MNLLFWLALAGMTLLALVFLLWPLWHRSVAADADRRQLNIEIYRERQAELAGAVAAGQIPAEEAAVQQAELERNLLHDLAETPAPPAAAAGRRGRLYTGLVLLALLPALAVSFYLANGDWRLSIAGGGLPAAEVLLERLAQHLETQPEDRAGWQLLGRGQLALRRYAEAAAAFARVNALNPAPVPDDLVAEAEARALAADGRTRGPQEALVAQALQLDARHPRALWYASLAALEAGDQAGAIVRLEQLAQQDLPADFRQTVAAQLARLRGLDPALAVAPPPGAGVRIRLRVALDPRFSGLPAGTPVFVYARAVQGSRMPLAVLRRTVGELPLTLELSDAQAMAPGRRLSDHPQWIVGARVALQGAAQPQSGDPYTEQRLERSAAAGELELRIDRPWP